MTRTRVIPLTQGRFAIVDSDMHDALSRYKWYYTGRYAARYCRDEGRVGGSRIYMHRVVNRTPVGLETDHIDGDPLNNTRANLRAVTRSENTQNAAGFGSSEFLGVRLAYGKPGKWRADINRRGDRKYLGVFTREVDAALAYDMAALELFGPSARLNFPPKLDEGGEPKGFRGMAKQHGLPLHEPPGGQERIGSLTGAVDVGEGSET